MIDQNALKEIFEHGDFEETPIVRDLPELNESEIDLGGGEGGPFMEWLKNNPGVKL